MNEYLKNLSNQFLAGRHLLMAFIYGLMRNAPAAEDIFQEVWVKLAEAAEKGIRIQYTAKWCRGVARNLVFEYWRERRKYPVAAEGELIELAEQAFNSQALEATVLSARRQALVECIEDLQEKPRKILSLKYEQGLSMATVARKIGSSTSAVMMALSRVRCALAQCVERKINFGESV